VTWLVPHQLAQVLPADVDFTVMVTFLEFYATLVQFVMFKLYHNLGLRCGSAYWVLWVRF
jgi:pescadillo protein